VFFKAKGQTFVKLDDLINAIGKIKTPVIGGDRGPVMAHELAVKVYSFG
jgi:hypothetical protein